MPEGIAFIMTPLDIVYMNSQYNLTVCYKFTQENGTFEIYPVNVFMRQKNYPFTKLTNETMIEVGSGNEQCQTFSLVTNSTLLTMDLTNFAVLVFDLAPDMSIFNGSATTPITLFLSKMELETNRLPAANLTRPTTKNIIKSIKQVAEGWEA